MMNAAAQLTKVFICGSVLRGQPDNRNLKGAEFVGECKTAPIYRLHVVGNDWHPGIYQVEHGGVSILGELYAMTAEQFIYLKDSEPPNMYPEEVQLADGSTAIAFLYPRALIEKHNCIDISSYGGWAAYKAASAPD